MMWKMSAARKVLALQAVFLALFVPRISPVTGANDVKKPEVLVYTVATEANDGFQRFMRSANKYNHKVQVLGMGKKWEGGDVERWPGGGQKINLLKEGLERIKDEKDTLVMFVDSYDLVLLADAATISRAFKRMDASVIFSAEDFCWPDLSLRDVYPEVGVNEKRFLNSGGFIGYAPQLYEIVSSSSVQSNDDDQLFYTKIFLDKTKREQLKIKLDTHGEIFQNLNGALEEVKVNFKGSNSFLYNMKTGHRPLVAHGNGPIKVQFNQLSNYLADQWTPSSGCRVCSEGTITLQGLKDQNYPEVMLAVFIEQPTPFVEDCLQRLAEQKYPKNRIDLFIHYADDLHKGDVANFTKKYSSDYRTMKVYTPVSRLQEDAARNKALEECSKKNCEYLFMVDGNAQLENVNTLSRMIEINRTVIAPMLVRPTKLWSNFWGAIGSDGFYKRSDDYLDLIQNKRRGLWNVPYLTGAVLVHGYKVPSLLGTFSHPDLDTDMSFAYNLRKQGTFMYVDNQDYYGHLVYYDNFDTSHLHNDMYSIFDNPYTWEKKYILPGYFEALQPDFVNPEPCTDVFWFPLMTDALCDHLVEEMENFGQWSGGGHSAAPDMRLQGGYENVPTVDIHTNQIGWEAHWLHILKTYIVPLTTKVFEGYYSEAKAVMNFVVRYRPGSQDRLKPHNDASTFTINVALNQHAVDYEGGGPRFIRYDCKVQDTKKGWLLMHPGRLTHHHEGLPTTAGTRYIMVSFVDP